MKIGELRINSLSDWKSYAACSVNRCEARQRNCEIIDKCACRSFYSDFDFVGLCAQMRLFRLIGTWWLVDIYRQISEGYREIATSIS